MLNDKLSAGRKIAKSLGSSEAAIDQSLIAGAELLISICDGRLKTGAAAGNASRAVITALSGLDSLGKARENFVACHEALAELRDRAGLSPTMVGCTPDKFRYDGESPPLAAVS